MFNIEIIEVTWSVFWQFCYMIRIKCRLMDYSHNGLRRRFQLCMMKKTITMEQKLNPSYNILDLDVKLEGKQLGV